MAKLVWDAVGDRLFEGGVKNGVLFTQNTDGTYNKGVAWNGLTGVTEKPDGAEPNAMYADDIKYAAPRSKEEFKATIEAYTYPDEFAPCCGETEIAEGVTIGQQKHQAFGLCYRTAIGNDTEDFSHGYKLHIVYGATAAPVEKSYETINENPEAITFSWDIETIPVEVTGCEPTAIVTINSLTADETKLAALEAMLYGTDAEGGNAGTDPTLPLPDTIKTMMSTTTTTTP